MPQPTYPQPGGNPMRRFAVFVAVFAIIVAVGSQPRNGNSYSGIDHHSWHSFFGGIRAHAKANNHTQGAALGTADGWTLRDCSGTNSDHTNWGWGHRERACELRSITIASPSKLNVSSMNGGIDIVGEDRKDVQIEARVESWADSVADATEILREIRIETGNGTVQDKGPNFHWGSKGYGISYTIHAPHQLSAELKTLNGGIDLSHLNGNLRFDTTNGGVGLTDLSGNVKGSTVNGGLDIALTGSSWQGSGLDAETTNGGITLNIPENYAAHLNTGTVNGGIEVNFPVTVQGEIKHHLETDLGSGGPTIHAETTNGGVTICHANGKGDSEAE
jgi:hypothetical protein